MADKDTKGRRVIALGRRALASRAPKGFGGHLDTQTLESHTSRHQNLYIRSFQKWTFQADYYIIVHSHLNVNTITIHYVQCISWISKFMFLVVHLNMLWSLLKIGIPKIFMIANFEGQPNSSNGIWNITGWVLAESLTAGHTTNRQALTSAVPGYLPFLITSLCS